MAVNKLRYFFEKYYKPIEYVKENINKLIKCLKKKFVVAIKFIEK